LERHSRREKREVKTKPAPVPGAPIFVDLSIDVFLGPRPGWQAADVLRESGRVSWLLGVYVEHDFHVLRIGG